jgi:hypothetical protein
MSPLGEVAAFLEVVAKLQTLAACSGEPTIPLREIKDRHHFLVHHRIKTREELEAYSGKGPLEDSSQLAVACSATLKISNKMVSKYLVRIMIL